MSFKELIRSNSKKIVIGMEHITSITFDDICTLIYLIDSGSKVYLSDEAKKHLNYDLFDFQATVVIENSDDEKFVILLYLIGDIYCGDTFNIDINYYSEEQKCYTYNPKYKMSDRFILAAKKYGLYGHPYVSRIICNYGMYETIDMTEANKSFEKYMKC